MTLLHRLYDGFYAGVRVFAWACVAFMAVGISIDVFMRNFDLGSIGWILEVSEYALFLLTFLGAPWVLHLGAHVRVDFVLTGLPPAAGRVLEAIGDVVGLVVSCVLLYYSGTVAANAHEMGALVIKVLIFPEWWVFAIVAFSSALLVIEFVVRLVRLAGGGGIDQTPSTENRGL